MKILHVITSLRMGGAEKLMVDLLPRLKAEGHDVDLLLFDGVETPFRKDIEQNKIRIYDFGKGGSMYSPLKLIKLISFLKRYDLIHTHNYSPQIFAAIGSLFHPVMLFTTEHNTNNRRRGWPCFRVIDRWMYNRYNKIICISQRAEDNLRSYLNSCKAEICTINNGVDIAKYAYAQPSEELEHIAPNSRKIIMVAGFRWEKDQDTLIRALKYLPNVFHLFLIGDGIRRNDIEEIIKAENLEHRVHLLGLRTDVPQLLHAADYIVMSSHFEGLSLSSVEGMSVGKPFIASDVDGLREVVTGAGLLFPHQDAKSLANIIINLNDNNDKYNSIAVACSERAKQFDISKMVTAYNQCYKELRNE
ncbi:MAG: glycosyltransferase [Muribaculum sp.]|nr:glycosyltransferase [Muribaculum sp.]